MTWVRPADRYRESDRGERPGNDWGMMRPCRFERR
jgi:hypothetical protein